MPDTNIINLEQMHLLFKWLGEDGSNGELSLLYRGIVDRTMVDQAISSLVDEGNLLDKLSLIYQEDWSMSCS
jgi:hypothetical protein